MGSALSLCGKRNRSELGGDGDVPRAPPAAPGDAQVLSFNPAPAGSRSQPESSPDVDAGLAADAHGSPAPVGNDSLDIVAELLSEASDAGSNFKSLASAGAALVLDLFALSAAGQDSAQQVEAAQVMVDDLPRAGQALLAAYDFDADTWTRCGDHALERAKAHLKGWQLAVKELTDALPIPQSPVFPSRESAARDQYYKAVGLAGQYRRHLGALRTGINQHMSRLSSSLSARRRRLHPMQNMLLVSSNLLPTGRRRPAVSILKTMPIYDPSVTTSVLLGVRVLVIAWFNALEGMLGEADVNSRAIGFTSSGFGGGKTHLIIDMCFYKNRLHEHLFCSAADAEGIAPARWDLIARAAKNTDVCIINFNGHSVWCRADGEFIKIGIAGPASAAGGPPPSSTASRGRSGQGGSSSAGGASGETGRRRGTAQGPSSSFQDLPVECFLPLYARVLWCLLCSETLSYEEFADAMLTELRAGRCTAAAVRAEARSLIRARDMLVVVDELKMASTVVNARPLYEYYRRDICTFTTLGRTRVFFAVLSFDFVADELVQQAKTNISYAAIRADPPDFEKKRLRTPGPGGDGETDGSPWVLTCFATLCNFPVRAVATAVFAPVFARRALAISSQVNNQSLLEPAVAAAAFANLSMGHPRFVANLRQMITHCRSGTTAWDVIRDAAEQVGPAPAVNTLMSLVVFHPIVLVVGLLGCAVPGRGRLGYVDTPDSVSRTWDGVFRNFVLSGSADLQGNYHKPTLLPLVLAKVAVSLKPRVFEMRQSWAALPNSAVALNILSPASSIVDAARLSRSGDYGWEVSCYWGEVLRSRLRSYLWSYCQDNEVLQVESDFSCIAVSKLFPGVDNLCDVPVDRSLLDRRVDATKWVDNASEPGDAGTLRTVNEILTADTPKELLARVYKMQQGAAAFDAMLFLQESRTSRCRRTLSRTTALRSGSLRRSSSGASAAGPLVDASEMVCVGISYKFTADPTKTLDLNSKVVTSLVKMKTVFGVHWETWKNRVLLVVVTNHKNVASRNVFLSRERAARTILVTQEHLEEYFGPSISHFLLGAHAFLNTRVVDQGGA